LTKNKPLAGIVGGADYISTISSELISKINEEEVDLQYITDNLNTMNNTSADLNNINSFMLMTINRCLDYTKASSGMKLVPKYETIDLLDALQMPLRCMKEQQNPRIKVVLSEIQPNICSHIITDKQWLQENIFCLLSNAIKYSHEGLIELSVFLSRGGDFNIRNTENNNYNNNNNLIENGYNNNNNNNNNVYTNNVNKNINYYNVNNSNNNNNNNNVNHNSSHKIKNLEYKNSDENLNLIFENEIEMFKKCKKKVIFNTKSIDEMNDKEDLFLLFEIEDHGIGISEDAMLALFKPFKQAQRLAGGTGLGIIIIFIIIIIIIMFTIIIINFILLLLLS
jgi:signal transduction histidine kinase